MPASVFCPCWRDAEFILASAFSCPDLNAGLEPRVCGIYATRTPRLLFPRLPFLRRKPRVYYSRVCYFRDANSRVCEPSRLTFKTRALSPSIIMACSEFRGFRTFRLSGDLGECSRYPLDFLFSLIIRVISLYSWLSYFMWY